MKIYLVTIDQGAYDDYHWWIDSIWKSPAKAKDRKREILRKVDFSKLDYESKHGSYFENDQKYIDTILEEDFDEIEYDKLVERVYKFEQDNPEMEYNNINVVEKYLL